MNSDKSSSVNLMDITIAGERWKKKTGQDAEDASQIHPTDVSLRN